MRVLTRFMLSASAPSHFPPPGLPEVAFLGRSNVGKSSVINSLVGAKIAKTSNTPGRTQAINFFEIRWPGKPEAELIFADLPGYGYAKISREVSSQWQSFIDPYLHQRSTLALCLALVDISIPPQASDRQLLDFLIKAQRKFLVIATKSDRVSSNQLHVALKTYAQEVPEAKIIPYSARSGTGRDELWREIRQAVPDNHMSILE
ncbi:MAG: ribosome biogenesis GTP-binding protein YihA/YsxC [Terriglobales bacterium]|jgi:GTP-binding protein